MGIAVVGPVFVDIKGYPDDTFIPAGRNKGRVEYVHGGVARNIAEDIANCELRPTLVSLVDETGAGMDVMKKLRNHKVNTDYIRTVPGGMGTWLAVFDNTGDVVASISKRPDLEPLLDILEQQGDEIIANCDSVILDMDIDKEIIKRVLKLSRKYGKRVYAETANMSIAMERRDFLQEVECFICNIQEAGILFFDDYSQKTPEEMVEILSERIAAAKIPSMIVTMGGSGAVYANDRGEKGFCPARKVEVKDTTGAGDSFCAGVVIGLTYGKDLKEACDIGTMLAASVIVTTESVCPRFQPRELGLEMDVVD